MIKRKKNILPSKTSVIGKTIFLILLLIISFISGFFINQNIKSPSRPVNIPKTKGVSIGKSVQSVDNQINTLKKQIPETIGEIDQSIIKSVNKAKSDVKQGVDDVIYSAAIKPIVDQIKKLPEDQQKEIQKAICE